MTVRTRLHWLLFRKEHHELVRIRKDLADIDARYTAKVNSLWRSNPEEKEWSSRFVALEKDYQALERDWRYALLRALNAETAYHAATGRILVLPE